MMTFASDRLGRRGHSRICGSGQYGSGAEFDEEGAGLWLGMLIR